jgi:WD40 repeat protein
MSSQMYISAPAFIPEGTKLLKTYQHEFTKSTKLLYHGHMPQFWDACLQTIEGHGGAVTAATSDVNGNYIASASSDHTIQLWDAASGMHLKTLYGHTDSVSCVAFSPNGEYLLTGSYDLTVKMWDISSGEVLCTIERHKNIVTSVAFSPNGDCIASASFDATLRIVQKPLESLNPLNEQILDDHLQVGLTAVCFSPDNIHIVSGSQNHVDTIQLWNLETGKRLHKFKGHSAPVYSVAFSNTGTQIISGSYDSTIRLWDVKTGSQ